MALRFLSAIVAFAALALASTGAASSWVDDTPSRERQTAQADDPLRERPKRATQRRFVSLRSDEVNVRVGPGVRYPVKWVFRQKSIPVEVVQEYDTWRKIRDWEGAEGWVHRAMLSSRRSVIVTGRTATLRRRSSDEAPAVARLARGIVAELGECTPVWCRVEVDGYEGWLRREGLWGIRKDEILP
jgi:SH3-like domain-containing protein